MHQAIYEELQRVAKAQRVTAYSEIAPLAGLDMANPDAGRGTAKHTQRVAADVACRVTTA